MIRERMFCNLDNGLLLVARFDEHNMLVGAAGKRVQVEMIELDHVLINGQQVYDIVGISECDESVVVEVQ